MSNILSCPSSSQSLATVEAWLSDICVQNNIYNYFATISVAVLNAVSNAVVHGNKSNPDKLVTIQQLWHNGGISFLISDQGDGFDFSSYSNCLPDHCSGIFTIQSLADRCSYSNGGSSLLLEFDIAGIDMADALNRIARLHQFFAAHSPSHIHA